MRYSEFLRTLCFKRGWAYELCDEYTFVYIIVFEHASGFFVHDYEFARNVLNRKREAFVTKHRTREQV
ncbi:hypothetical protein CR164_08320 [Prosthecochloris marina]|uniref:Uncharacterized protein n=1 Tax=Prosthecochloris marina TaxID=2017681 RepID=A0A317T8R5_9CHLB|nr:hypothetical protein CR164_08320 [Prosthecochloris marina]